MDLKMETSTKSCSGCRRVKDETEFHVKNKEKGVRHGRCAECQRASLRRHYKRNKTYYQQRNARRRIDVSGMTRDLKRSPCSDCGVSYPPYVMDFDHRPGEAKLGSIGEMCYATTAPRLLREIAKCDVVCSNCHRERTHQRMVSKQRA